MDPIQQLVIDRLEAMDKKFDDKLDKILVQTTKTNGRVNGLEQWRRQVDKLIWWVVGAIVAVAAFFIQDWVNNH
jgi:hypothetical protein